MVCNVCLCLCVNVKLCVYLFLHQVFVYVWQSLLGDGGCLLLMRREKRKEKGEGRGCVMERGGRREWFTLRGEGERGR